MTRIAIDPVTRVEGHGKVTIVLDEYGTVRSARFHVVEFRGFERFIQGRPIWEAAAIVQRLCGICPVSHHLAAAKAIDAIAGIDGLTPSAEKVRRLAHYAQVLQSHALHFFYLAAPDLLFGADAPLEQRSIVGLAAAAPDLAKRAIAIRSFGQRIIETLGGKRIHPAICVPGGVNAGLERADRERFAAEIDAIVGWCADALELGTRLVRAREAWLGDFAAAPSNYVSLVRADGALDLYDGCLRAIDADGCIIVDGVPAPAYAEVIAEDVRSWSYMKFPYLRALGSECGWYRVGPLAQLNCAAFLDTPLAEAARAELRGSTGGKPVQATLAQHWARLIVMLHCAETIGTLLADDDLQGTDLVRPAGTRRRAGTGWLEAPRGTLFHHYEVDENDLIVRADLIVATTSNNEALNRSIASVARAELSGHEITDALLNLVEVAIRAYDPCLSCATHALGTMPLGVTLEDRDGTRIAYRLR